MFFCEEINIEIYPFKRILIDVAMREKPFLHLARQQHMKLRISLVVRFFL